MRKMTESRGSIMIWTLLLGISLATVFFFFSQRLNSNVEAQRETIQYQNARLFFESYVAYIESLDTTTLISLRGDLSFDGITGTLTNEADEIVGRLDMGAEATYEVTDGNARIDWNLCPDEEGIMEITPVVSAYDNTCTNGYKTYTQTSDASFTLRALGEPFTYKVSPVPDAKIYGPKWQLDLEYNAGFRKKLTTSVSFTPES